MKAAEVPKPIGRATHDSSCRYIRDGYYLQRCCCCCSRRRCCCRCCSRRQTHYDCHGVSSCLSLLSRSLSSLPLPTHTLAPQRGTTRTPFGPLDFAPLEASSFPPAVIYRPGGRGDWYLTTVNRDSSREIHAIYERVSERTISSRG